VGWIQTLECEEGGNEEKWREEMVGGERMFIT